MNQINYQLLIPFNLKEEVKESYQIRWDSTNKTWKAMNSSDYNKLSDYHIKIVKIHYDHKDSAKLLGCKWNGTSWYTNNKTYDEHHDEFDTFETKLEPKTTTHAGTQDI